MVYRAKRWFSVTSQMSQLPVALVVKTLRWGGGTLWSDRGPGIGCPAAAVDHVNALLRLRRKIAGQGVAGMTDFGKRLHPVKPASPAGL